MQHNCPDIPKYQLHFSNAQDCEYYKHRTLVHIKQNSGVQSRSIIGEHSARVLLKKMLTSSSDGGGAVGGSYSG